MLRTHSYFNSQTKRYAKARPDDLRLWAIRSKLKPAPTVINYNAVPAYYYKHLFHSAELLTMAP